MIKNEREGQDAGTKDVLVVGAPPRKHKVKNTLPPFKPEDCGHRFVNKRPVKADPTGMLQPDSELLNDASLNQTKKQQMQVKSCSEQQLKPQLLKSKKRKEFLNEDTDLQLLSLYKPQEIESLLNELNEYSEDIIAKRDHGRDNNS